MEEFFLDTFFSSDELNVVHQQHIRFSVLLSEIGSGMELDGFDHFIGKILTFDIDHVIFGMIFSDIVADRVKQMGFSQSGVTV